jgi:citrate lyase subunit beta/citryl-CoA lyase
VISATDSDAPSPRSLLFFPAHVPRYLASAATSGADAVVLDLEDSVLPADKDAARSALAPAIAGLSGSSDVLVRVNADAGLLGRDLAQCAGSGARHVLLPKVSGPGDLDALHHALGRLGYAPEVSILIESCTGVMRIPQILDVAGPLRSVALGVEDLRHELELSAPGDDSASPALLWAHGALIVAATAAGVPPLGILGSISEFSDLDRLAQQAAASWRTGYRGSYCIHPAQVPVLNAAYAASDLDVLWAREVLSAAEDAAAHGRGAFTVRGRMVDAPLVERAARIQRAQARRQGHPPGRRP